MHILFSYLKKYWKLCILVLFLATVNMVFSMLDPYIVKIIIDEYASKFSEYTQAEFVSGVIKLLALTILVAFISRVAKNFQDYYLNTITKKLGAELYADGVEHSLALPYQVFEDQRSGETLNLLQKARTDSETLITSFVNFIFTSLVGFIFVAIYSIKLHWGIAVSFALAAPTIGGITYLLSRRIKNIQEKIVKATSALAGSTTESLRNIELVKSLGLSDQEIERLNDTTSKILSLELQKLKYIRSMSFVQGTLVNFVRTCVTFFMFLMIFRGVISVGDFFSLLIYTFFVFEPLQMLGTILGQYRETEVSLHRYQEIKNMPVEPTPKDAKNLPNLENIEFKNVSFSYVNANGNAVDDISFEVNKGETVAFVGPSGSGKTSVIKLLVGLYPATKGEVIFNGISGKEINLNDLRSQIGFVTQDTQLFAGTIRENLLFVNPKATDEECLEVLRKSACEPLLARADKGLDTIIGEGGVKISGGEKQRLSIARALLRKPNLLVFDEATSSLDSITEEEITKTVKEITDAKEHITVLVAHRLSTVMHADNIYVLEKGIISEQGTHDELLASKGLYYAMWRQQIGERV